MRPLLLLLLLALFVAPLASAQEDKGGSDAASSAATATVDRFPVEIDGKWGYVDRQGALVIEPQYDQAWPFREGRARVLQFGRFGFIDAAGALAVPLRFDNAYDFSGGRARVEQFEAAYSGQRRRVLPAGRKLSGYVGPGGEVVVPPRYYEGRDFADGVAPVRLMDGLNVFNLFWLFKRPTTWAVIGPDGEVRFDSGDRDFGRASEGRLAYQERGALFSSPRWGYLDTEGRAAIAPQFSRAHGFSDGLACVGLDDRSGYVDADGRLVIAAEFEGCGRFSGGVAPVQDPESDRWGYVDEAGAWVTEPQFLFADQVEEGLAMVQAEDERFGFVAPGDGYVLPAVYDWARPFEGGLAYVRQGTVEGYVDRTGAFVWQKPAEVAAGAGE